MSGMIKASLEKLLGYVVDEGYAGYDPYDTLKSPVPFHWLGKWGPVLAIQFQKRNPVNIRPLIGVKKGRNPKAIGLFLRAYSMLYRSDPRSEYRQRMREFFSWLREHPSKGYSCYCWGYDFPWASPVKYVDAYAPNIVATGFVVKGMYEYWLALGAEVEAEVREVLEGAADFVLKHLERIEDATGVCISYTPVMKDACYNASLLGAEILARYSAVTGSDIHRDLIERSVDFVVARQLDNGCWNYSIDIESGKERVQIDFHQGYVIESIEEIMCLTGNRKLEWVEAVSKGLEFYRNEQFLDTGRSKWRLPKEWPVEIHNQAQGIVTFRMFDEYRDFADTIAEYTIREMQDKRGYFYYQKFPWYTNKISYMRWSNAWMAVALSTMKNAPQSSQRTQRTNNEHD
jgi:hypothetical protein